MFLILITPMGPPLNGRLYCSRTGSWPPYSIKTALAEKHVLATILPARKKEKDPP